LSPERYRLLTTKTKDHPIEHFGSASPLTFNYLVEKYTGQQGQKTENYVNPFATKVDSKLKNNSSIDDAGIIQSVQGAL